MDNDGTKHCAHKEVVFLWLVLQKGMAVNEWQGRISDKEDKKILLIALVSI